MSTKSILLMTGLFLILCSQNNTVLAAPDSDEESDIGKIQSDYQMGPLLRDDNAAKVDLMSEAMQLPSMGVPMKMNEMNEMVVKLDVMDLFTPAMIASPTESALEDDITANMFFKKAEFSLVQATADADVRMSLKTESLKEQIENSSAKLSPFYQSFFSYQRIE